MTVKLSKAQLWRFGILRWKLHEVQKKIYDQIQSLPDDVREVLIFCARGIGKSYLAEVQAIEDCIRNPNVHVAIIGPSLKHCKDIVIPLMKLIIEDAPKGLIRQYRSTTAWHFSNGSVLSLGGFDTALESFRGRTLFNIYMEETGFSTADQDEYNYILYSVLMSTLRSRVGGRIQHLTTPARLINHPLHIETLPKCKISNAFYKYTIEDNPMLTREQKDREIETLGGIDSITVQRELFCEIKRDDSITVVPQFDAKSHVAEYLPAHLKYFVGGDLGYTIDRSAFVLAGYDHEIGKVVVIDEMHFPPTTSTTEIVEALEEWRKAFNPTFIVDIQGNTRTDMAVEGLGTVTPVKDKFDSTVTFIRNEFYNDRVLINPNCKLLIETLESATFNKPKTDFLRTAALGHADALMALVYLLRSIDKQTDLRPKKPTKHLISSVYPAKPNPLTKLIS